MDNRMPSYLGRVITPDNPSKMTKFAMNKYGPFSNIYHKCKDESENITDITCIDEDDDATECSIRLVASQDTLSRINDSLADEENMYMDQDVIIAKK